MECRELDFDTLPFSMMRRRRCEVACQNRQDRQTAHIVTRCRSRKRRGSHENGLQVFCDMLPASTVLKIGWWDMGNGLELCRSGGEDIDSSYRSLEEQRLSWRAVTTFLTCSWCWVIWRLVGRKSSKLKLIRRAAREGTWSTTYSVWTRKTPSGQVAQSLLTCYQFRMFQNLECRIVINCKYIIFGLKSLSMATSTRNFDLLRVLNSLKLRRGRQVRYWDWTWREKTCVPLTGSLEQKSLPWNKSHVFCGWHTIGFKRF
jgi:hypothetical protein